MRIPDIGGEFALIERLARQATTTHPDLITGIGDDAAVIDGVMAGDDHLLVTTDMLVESSHFRRDWATPQQIGIKSVACNVSDIAAMGGIPTFMFASLALPPDTDVAWVESLYRGMERACHEYGVVLAGGDTTHGSGIVINITLLGRVSPDNLCLRSHARAGDLLCVTGYLGSSAAGLAMLAAGMDPPRWLKDKHVAPRCRLDISPHIAPMANAMIDISDGLAAEVNHICDQSGTGAEIEVDKIPVHEQTQAAASRTGKRYLDFALAGGEDFELLFSITEPNRQFLADQAIDAVVIGRVTDAPAERMLVFPDGKRVSLGGGYNHFA